MTRSLRPRIVAACTALLLVVQAVWLIGSPDAPEGPIIVTFTTNHGLTVADLLGVVLALMALALWFVVVFASDEAGAAVITDGRSPLPRTAHDVVPSTREEHRGGPSWSSARTSSS